MTDELITAEKLAELRSRYGKIWTFDVREDDLSAPTATLVFRKPTEAEYEEWELFSSNEKEKAQLPTRRKAFVQQLVVYPDAGAFRALCAENPALPLLVYHEVDLILGQKRVENAKKA